MPSSACRATNSSIATKVHGRVGKGANGVGQSRCHIMNAIDESLKRLQLDHVDLYQIHGFDPATPLEETLSSARTTSCARQGPLHRLVQSARVGWHEDARDLPIAAARRGSSPCRRTTRSPPATSSARSCRWRRPKASASCRGRRSPEACCAASSAPTAGPEGRRRAQFDFPVVDKPRAFRCVDAMRPIADAPRGLGRAASRSRSCSPSRR